MKPRGRGRAKKYFSLLNGKHKKKKKRISNIARVEVTARRRKWLRQKKKVFGEQE